MGCDGLPCRVDVAGGFFLLLDCVEDVPHHVRAQVRGPLRAVGAIARSGTILGTSRVGGAAVLLGHVGLPGGDVHLGLGDHGFWGEGFAEDGFGEVQHHGRVPLRPQCCGGRHRGDVAQGALVEAVAAEVFQPQTQPAQQQGHVGALGSVIGVELIEHDVLQRVGGKLPHQLVGVPKQQLIEHLVVRQQDVRRILAHGVPVGD